MLGYMSLHVVKKILAPGKGSEISHDLHVLNSRKDGFKMS